MSKMQENYKELDSRFKALLENAEEEVPQYISDNVFARLDAAAENRGDHKVIPVWLRWTSAVASVAAAVLLALLLWPEDSVKKVYVGAVTAMVESVEHPADASVTGPAPVEEVLPVKPASSPKVPDAMPVVNGNEAVVVFETGEEPDCEQETQGMPVKEVPDIDNIAEEESIDKEVSEESGVAAGNDVKEVEDRWDGPDYQDNEPGWEEDNDRVSLVLGSNLSSNGNAKGIGRFGGFRAPAMGTRNDTWIEQTGTESSYAIPVTFGLGAKIPLAKRWAIGTGLNYTMLQRTFSGVYTKVEDGVTVTKISSDVRNNLHYIGIPVNVYFDIIDSHRFRLYAFGGGAVEKGVLNSFRVKNNPKDIILKEKVKGVQLSAGAGFGVEFMIVDRLGVYLDPGFRYYFDCGQPISIRTQQQFMMDFQLGFRVEI